MELVVDNPPKLEEDEEDRPKRRSKRRAGDDWKTAAPRWFLLLLLLGASYRIGTQNSKIEEQQKLADAMIMIEAKSRERAMERIAVTEEQNRQYREWFAQQREWNERFAGVVGELTSSVKVLATEVRATRRD